MHIAVPLSLILVTESLSEEAVAFCQPHSSKRTLNRRVIRIR